MPFTLGGSLAPNIKTQPQLPPTPTTWTPKYSAAPSPTVSANTLWMWHEDAPGFAPYKNEILAKYQAALSQCGIPHTDQRLFLQQVTQENGALDPSTTGGTDHGYSFGIGQWNVYPAKAKTHLAKYPEKATLDWQINELARSSCSLYKKYPGNVRRAIVAHNCPECSLHNARPSLCSGVDAIRKISGRWSCYFDDEVNSSASKARFE